MLRLFVALLALYVVLEWILKAEGLATFFAFVLVIVGLILAVRLIRHVIRKSIWRLRYRLIVTYVFIGVVPIVLILILAVLGTWIVVGQVAVYLVSSELERRAAVLTDPVHIISQAKPSARAATIQQLPQLFDLGVNPSFLRLEAFDGGVDDFGSQLLGWHVIGGAPNTQASKPFYILPR